MRLWVALIAAILFLVACAEGILPPVDADPETPANAEQPADTGYVFDEDGPKPVDTPPPDPKPEREQRPLKDPPEDVPETAAKLPPKPEKPDQNAAARLACTKKKGRLAKTPAGFFVCVTETGQGQKSCSSANDCKGVCLARSGTCAPFTPLIGCNEIITAQGGMSTVCID